MIDTRRHARYLFDRYVVSVPKAVSSIVLCVLLALVVGLAPEYAGLSGAGRGALFILVLAAGLWITEAIPAFAVALLVIGLEIAILGRPGGLFADDPHDWERFIAPWGSPLIWLFFGGFVMAAGAEKTRLTHWLSGAALAWFGRRPPYLLLGCMAVTFTFSMFVSNTATATMMVAVLAPVFRSLSARDRFAKGLLLGVAFSANLGGMATLIGSPPNAIAAGALADVDPINFMTWMFVGLPPAVVLVVVAWGFLVKRYPSEAAELDVAQLFAGGDIDRSASDWRKWLVIVTFCLTVGMWLTGQWHGIPTTVVSFLPICLLTAAGVLDAEDVREIPWDVLLLIAGGLSLGVAITDTGLAAWLVSLVPVGSLGVVGVALAMAVTTALLSNVMSNTAAANVLVPIAVLAASDAAAQTVAPMALGASAAMCLPISTPPNAIVYGTARLQASDFLAGGLLIGVLAPPLVVAWAAWML